MTDAPEFSRIISVSRLGDAVAVYPLVANRDECAALSQRFGLVALDGLTAEVSLTRAKGEVRLEATLEADIVQDCVVTLEPFSSHLSEAFTLVYRRERADRGAVDVEDDDVEPLLGDEIDVGEAVAQQLSLALDPFPRAPGAELPAATSGKDSPEMMTKPHPFADLAKLRKK